MIVNAGGPSLAAFLTVQVSVSSFRFPPLVASMPSKR